MVDIKEIFGKKYKVEIDWETANADRQATSGEIGEYKITEKMTEKKKAGVLEARKRAEIIKRREETQTNDSNYYFIRAYNGYIAPFGDDKLCYYSSDSQILCKIAKKVFGIKNPFELLPVERGIIGGEDGFLYFTIEESKKVFEYAKPSKMMFEKKMGDEEKRRINEERKRKQDEAEKEIFG